MDNTEGSGTTISYSKAYDAAEEELSHHLPPWEECTCSQKVLLVLLHIGIMFPVIVLISIVLTSYSIYLILLIYPLVGETDDDPELYYWHSEGEKEGAKIRGFIYLTIMTLCVVMFLWSHVKAMTTSPGGIPESEEWNIPSEESSESECSDEKQKETRKDGSKRTCGRCQKKKPDRAHHCKQCERCNLKMDHHCNWIANCVGFFNYKYFFLMVFYGAIMLLLFVTTFWECVVVTLNDETSSTGLCFIVLLAYSLLLMLAIAVVGFLYFHLWLIWNNFSTIEYCEKRKLKLKTYQNSPFNQGRLNNFKQALGQNPWVWFLPYSYRTEQETGLYF